MMFMSARLSRGDRGSLAPSVAAIIVILFLLGGLVIDGARALGARSRATAYAEEGARIAGQGVSFDRGRLDLDSAAIRANAEEYCARISANDEGVQRCNVSQQAGDIIFTVDLTIDKGILGMVSADPTMTFTGEGRAIAEIGITEAQGSADGPAAVESMLIEGHPNEVNIDEAAGGQCPRPLRWTSPPVASAASPFEYYTKREYTQKKPAHCLIPPVCPNATPNQLVEVEHKYRKRRDEIDREVLRSSEGWEDLFRSCPTAEDLLYSFAPKPQCEFGEVPDPETCRPIPDLPPCPEGEEPGRPPWCNPLRLPTCGDGDKPGTPPTCRPPRLRECRDGEQPGGPPPKCRKPEEQDG